MRVLQAIYRRLDRMQGTLWFRIAATVVALAACGAYFGSLVGRAYSLDSQRRAIVTALSGQNLNNGDEHAVSLRDTGTIFVGGRTYGGEVFRNPRVFDEHGNIASPPRLAVAMLDDQLPAWAPIWLLEDPATALMLSIAVTVWLVLVVWMTLTLPLVLTVAGTAVPVAIMYFANKPQALLAVAGIGVLAFTFVMLTRASMILLNRSNQLLAVAHTVVKEAARTRVALVFILTLLVVLPMIPVWLDPASPLRFRVQSFISWSLGLTFALAAFMTLVLSCASVAFEIRDRQIWQLMTKPLSRMSYVAGKWLGVMVVNLNILIVAGLSTFTFVQYMRTLPVASGETGMLDRLAVNDEILTARLSARPHYAQLSDEQVRERVLQKIAADPNYGPDAEVPASKLRELARDARQEYSAGERMVAPGQGRIYIFHGLQKAKTLNATLTLRYCFHILEDNEHETYPVVFEFYDTENNMITARPPAKYVPTMSHSFPLGVDLIQDDGTLRVGVANTFRPGPEIRGSGSLNFEEKDFELMYKVGSFEGNFVRAMVMTWVKLAFLAAVGVSAATFLSFPVALLAAVTIFFAGLMSPFLAVALEWYIPPEAQGVDWSNLGIALRWVFEKTTSLIAEGLLMVFGAFGEVSPRQSLVEGRLIPWTTVLTTFLQLGALWSGVTLVIGFFVLRQRQLAIYSGQG
jgi:hypothetical protein